MPRRPRSIQGGLIYHVLNRSNARMPLFEKAGDYLAFLGVLEEAHERDPLRILSYCVMPNHWHMVVWPKRGADEQVSDFFLWPTATHTQRWHAHHHTSGTGHLYQGRFKSFPVESDEHLYTVLRYVERNPVRANLVARAEAWQWSSASRYYHASADARSLLADWPIARPRDWLKRVSRPETKAELDALRLCVRRAQPFGSESWRKRTIKKLGLEWTVRPRGRPRKNETAP